MLITKELLITAEARTINHYRDKGYSINHLGEECLIKTEDLPQSSHVKIQYQCDNCGDIFTTEWCSWTSRKYADLGDMCKKCAAKIKLPVIMTDKYGRSNSANIDVFIEKKKATNLIKYGNEWAIASFPVKDRIQDTNLVRYGVKNPMQNEAVKEKAKTTNIERYGGASALCDERVRQKSRETCLRKYGVENAFQLKENQEKARKTLYKNGSTPASKAEQTMCALLCSMFGREKCFPNYPVGALSLDCLVVLEGNKIDFEYDGVYWHKNRKQKDAARNAVLLDNGYKIIRIKANNQDTMPTPQQIQDAINLLIKENHHLVFIDMNNKKNI